MRRLGRRGDTTNAVGKKNSFVSEIDVVTLKENRKIKKNR